MLKRINQLMKSIERDGALDGMGKPEKLKGHLAGFYIQSHRYRTSISVYR